MTKPTFDAEVALLKVPDRYAFLFEDYDGEAQWLGDEGDIASFRCIGCHEELGRYWHETHYSIQAIHAARTDENIRAFFVSQMTPPDRWFEREIQRRAREANE